MRGMTLSEFFIMDGNQASRYRRNSHDALLLKLNRGATSVNADNVDAHPLPYWLELARKGLNKVPFDVLCGLTFLG